MSLSTVYFLQVDKNCLRYIHWSHTVCQSSSMLLECFLQFYKKLSRSYNSVICALFKTDVIQKYCQQFLSMLDADLSWPLCLLGSVVFMATLCNRGPIIFLPCSFFLLLLSSFFIPRLISAVTDWMSTILLHMARP